MFKVNNWRLSGVFNVNFHYALRNTQQIKVVNLILDRFYVGFSASSIKPIPDEELTIYVCFKK